jgi:hypothetical protein
LSAAILLGYGNWEWWQSNTYLECHCQVKFVEVIGPLRKTKWKPAWNITVLDEGNERTTKIDDKLILRTTYPKWWALYVAHKKEVRTSYLLQIVFFCLKKNPNKSNISVLSTSQLPFAWNVGLAMG